MATLPNASLSPGQSGDQVKQLQTWLIANGYSIPDGATGYYGSQTTAAVTALQKKLGVNAGSNFGYFGPLTISAVQASATQAPAASASPFSNAPQNAASPFAATGGQTTPATPFFPTATGAAPAGQNSGGSAAPAGNGAQGAPGGSQGAKQGDAGMISHDQAVALARTLGATDAQVASLDHAYAVTGGTASPYIAGTQIESTGDPKLDSVLTALNGYVQNNLALGNVVNPALQITPDLVSKFLDQAHSVVDPYYQQVMADKMTEIKGNLGTLASQYKNATDSSLAGFYDALGTERNNAGNAGVAFSGGRGLTEQNMLAAQNRTLGSIDTTYAKSIGDTLRAGGQAVGAGAPNLGGGVSGFNLPALSTRTASLEGARGTSADQGTLGYAYDPSTYKIGSIGSAYGSALTGQSNQFLSSYLNSAANNSARSFQNVNGVPTLQ